mmetsp:Transcript_41826/g.82044  ORF Transcript_41826/g.82044 Transcript_41826/m.82044 type:complete len:4055 (+) Transcript_41826:307-12471(+)
MSELKHDEVAIIINDLQVLLHALWNENGFSRGQPYPQHRMAHLLTVIGSQLAQYVTGLFAEEDMFLMSFNRMKQEVQSSLSLVYKWAKATKSLVQEWRARWEGQEVKDTSLGPLSDRLLQILTMRSVYEEVARVLPAEEREQLNMKKVLRTFQGMQMLHCGPLSQPKWESAVESYYSALAPIEQRAAAAFKERIGRLHNSPSLVVGELRNFENMLMRPVVVKALDAERENLVQMMTSYLQSIKSSFDSGKTQYSSTSSPSPGQHSAYYNGIVWCSQLTHKVKQVSTVVSKVFPNTAAISSFSSTSADVTERIQEFSQSLFQLKWLPFATDALQGSDDNLVQETSGSKMDCKLKFDGSSNKVIVSYSLRLPVILKEVKTVSELGFAIPPSLAKQVEVSQDYLQHGLRLKQVANFFNTTKTQIISSQRGMLLAEIQKVERIVSDHGGQVWSSVSHCSKFTAKLMAAVEALTVRNRKLRAVHVTLADHVSELMSTDLLKSRDSWIDKIKELQTIFNREERLTDAGSMTVWRHHWDHQLYKAFELQYRSCLEDLNENLMDIQVDLFYSRKRLNFRPPLEDLRSKYYRNLKKFLDLPKSFVGFAAGSPPASNSDSIYDHIPERNSQGLLGVYLNAEVLFDQLRELRDKYEHWVVLGSVDIEEFVDNKLSKIEDYERNFEVLAKKQREAARLPDTQKLGCFTISLVPFKTALDDLMHRFSDALLLSLRKKAAHGLKALNEYLDNALESLNFRPKTVKQMAEARKNWKTISSEKRKYWGVLVMVHKRNKVLRQRAVLSLDLSSLRPRWETFLVALEAFNDLLDEQKDSLKSDIDKRVKETRVSIDKFAHRWRKAKPQVHGKDMTQEVADRILSEIEDWDAEVAQLKEAVQELEEDTKNFDMPTPAFENLQAVAKDIEEHQSGWSLYGEYTDQLATMTKEAWVAFRARIFAFEDFLGAWTRKLEENKGEDLVHNYIATEVKKNKAIWPLLPKVTGELFEKEHWLLLFAKLKFPADVTLASLTLQHFLDAHEAMREEMKFLDHLSARARGEVAIREAVQELRVWADETEFSLLEYATTNKKTTHLIKDWKDLFTKISDQQSLVSSLKESPYFPPFADQATEFADKLALLDECLHSINQIQRKWVYLEPIFGRGSLPQEQARFKRIDNEFRGIMDDLATNPNVINLAAMPNLRDTTRTLLDQLERCQKALNDFLEEKRNKFARFYFIGDDDLLEILGQAQNPAVIQNHLKKLFAGIQSVVFSEDQKQIVAMVSSAKESVQLVQPVTITDSVEDWLEELSVLMADTLADLTVKAVRQDLDFAKFPSQVICLASMITFTKRVEDCLGGSGSLQSVVQDLEGQLGQLTTRDNGNDRLMQLKTQALVLDMIHNIEVAKLLISEGVTEIDHWKWQKQLRFYLNNKGRCIVRMTDAQFDYSYEYQGNAGKLVHTPLTDKCYLVLTQGMHLGYGGNPYGPAGTGKTESVKALGQALGRQVLVFNCDEGIDFQSMGRIFAGLVKSGAWGCFDEFNRLKEDQLSAVSQQIQVIQAALKQKESSCELLGKQIEVNFNAAIFVTMNPASKEYGGRSKLPHNLKQLFRAVAMSVPDIALISEVMLYSEGFQHAKEVGHKLTEVYSLSTQLLSPQKHYDWGLRALKTILGHAGQLVRHHKRNGDTVDLALECKLVIGSLKINTLSKLTYDDAIRFNGLINDVFPGISADEIDYAQLEAAIRSALDELHLEQVDTQVKKILQLNEALQQRMGVVIVGPSGCGKTVMLNVLHLALKKLGQPVVRHFMNPKALEREKLLGHMDHDTREWFDGVLTASARQVMKETADTHSWIINDGDIDPEWVESLNSVLDDNRLLTMPNGERIKFGSNVNFVFETHDLQFASPATISRMGMIFLSEENADIRALVTAWIKEQPEKLQTPYTKLMDGLFYKALNWVLSANCDVVPTTKVGLVLTGLSQMKGVSSKGDFVVRLIRGLGSNLPLEKRVQFAQEAFDWAKERPPERSAPLDCTYNRANKTYSQFAHENTKIPSDGLSVSSPPIINTVDMQRNRAIIQPWLKNMEPFILVGPEGCGKTLLLRSMFQDLKSASVSTIHCSAQTQAKHVVEKLMTMCSQFTTNKGRVLRPKEGDRLILFLKDLNLPKADIYDTIQLIAFLQQLVSYKGFHDDNLDWISIENVQIVASMNPATSVGRSVLSTRFTATVHIVYMSYPDHDQLESIYTAYVKAVFSLTPKMLDASQKTDGNVRKITSAMITVYEKLRKMFPSEDHQHYLFNPRDLTEWAFGLMRYDLGKENFLDVWTYEAYRLFCDRLVNRDSRSKFEALLGALLKSQWSYEYNSDVYYSSFQTVSAPAEEEAESQKLVLKEVGRILEKVSSKNFKAFIGKALYNYEREFKQLRMVLFPAVLDNIAFADRVLSRPGGSLLLVGDSGVGRRTSTILVSYILRMEFWTPSVPLRYDMRIFRNDLKELLKRVGLENKSIVMYIEDHQIVDEGVLEDVNSLLSAGQVPGLFSQAEIDSMLQPIKEEWGNDGRFKNCWDFFVDRIKTNLHIVLGMDPAHSLFSTRCESNPALLVKCTIMWMGKWDRSGMVQVPFNRLKTILKGKEKSEINGMLKNVVQVHVSMIPLKATPLKYVAFLDTYAKIFDNNHNLLVTKQSHLSGGLQKLVEAADMVDVLSKEAGEKKEKVTHKQAEADQALEEITESMAKASERRTEVSALQKVLAVEEKNLNARKKEINAELTDVQPILDSAKEAVSGIKKDNLNEIRALRMPPPVIAHVLEGVLTLLNQQDLSWSSMRGFLAKPSAKEEIINFDAESIAPSTLKKVAALLDKKAESFEADKVKRVSVAAAPLAAWVKANVKYGTVLNSIAPLRAEFASATTKLAEAQERLGTCETELKQLDDAVTSLKERFSKTTAEAEALKSELEKTVEILESAQSLLGKLSGEKVRWEEQTANLASQIESLPSHSLLAAGFVTYLSGFAEDFRRKMMGDWMKKFNIPSFNLMSFMTTESETLQWKAEGLPADTLSMQNALVLLNTVQTPFVIDPNSQASKWIQQHFKDSQLESVIMQDQRFVTTLELAVRFGKTLLIQEVDGIAPVLYPLLRKDLSKQGPRFVVQVGEKIIDYHDSFRVFLVTRDSAPDLSKDAKNLVTEINFTVTRSGLEGQLLGTALNFEKPELEKQKSELLAKEENLKIQLAGLEKQLLEELASSEGNILQNKALITSLDQTKTQSVDITKALKTSKQVQADLDKQREVYRPIANVGSVLFFLISDLPAVNHMYQFSLPTFNEIFSANLEQTEESSSPESRIAALCENLKLTIFRYITRSLFKTDRPMFAMHLIHCLYPEKFQPNEWKYFTGELVTSVDKAGDSLPEWSTSDRTSAFNKFAATFPDLVNQLRLRDSGIWNRWANSAACENEFPNFGDAVSLFQALLVTMVFRPDRLQSAINVYICRSLKIRSVSPAPLAMQKLVDETSATQPILFIATAGADPTQELEEFAVKTLGRDAFASIAMGSGQTEGALELLKSAASRGTWVCLKNLHLVTSWLYELEKILQMLKPQPSFRLWLTTEPHDNFPIILIQQSLKITYESPPGIKQNLLRTYENWEPSFISSGSVTRAQTFFCLSWFHAIVQERRTFIPQGWTKFYEFSFADLRSGTDVINSIFKRANPRGSSSVEPGSLPWQTIWGLMEFAIYGGRIDNDHDVRVLVTYLSQYFNPEALSRGRVGPLQLPQSNNHSEYLQLIHSLSDSDAPTIFNLPANIEGAVQQNQSQFVVSQLRKMAVSSSLSNKFNREQWRAQLTPLLQLWEKLTKTDEGALLKPPAKISMATEDVLPIDGFVVLESQKIFSVIKQVDTSMQGLSSLVFGGGLLTPSLKTEGTALMAGETPWSWARNWYGPEEPSAWIKEVAMRKIAVERWQSKIEGGSLLHGPLRLTELFRPRTFLNALRQQTARVSNQAIDNLKLVASWDASLIASATVKVTVEDMLLQGCLFDNGVLSPLKPNSPLFSQLPPVTLCYVNKEEREPYRQSLDVPVYFAPSREEFICDIKVPTQGDSAPWILSGSAIFLADHQ